MTVSRQGERAAMSDRKQQHFVLVPLMAQGHTIPMVDMALLLAEHGMLVSFITTPINASRIRPFIDRATASGLPISFIELQFPCAEAGLPAGCETLDLIPSPRYLTNFFAATALLSSPLQSYLRDHHHRPDCIIADQAHPWTLNIARELQVPWLVFHGTCCFTLLSYHNIRTHHETITTDPEEPFPIPNLPQYIEITRARASGFFSAPMLQKFRGEMMEAEKSADGVVLNSFDILESSYIKNYQQGIGKKAWAIGPLSQTRKISTINDKICLSWLDSMIPSSVIYVCFGSLITTPPSQLIEIGLGLEASGHPFIWVLKESEVKPIENWLSEELVARTKKRSMILKGWAPQAAILFHPAIGGFMTHCGWNSVLESMCSGVPMITWPHFTDQFLNEKLVVEILKIGVAVGAMTPAPPGAPRTSESLVGRGAVERAVLSLMNKEIGEERRKSVFEWAERASQAVRVGGSAHDHLTQLIEYVSGYSTV